MNKKNILINDSFEKNRQKCNKLNLFAIVFITLAEIVLIFGRQLSLSSHTTEEYHIAIVSLFFPLVLAVVTLLVLNANIIGYALRHGDKLPVKLYRLFLRKLLNRLIGR